MTADIAPSRTIENRISRFICRVERSGRSNRRQRFQLTIEAAERIDELKLEVTAPMIAPNPRSATRGGVAYSSSMGNVWAGWDCRRSSRSAGQAYLKAATPSSSGGIVNKIVNAPAKIEWSWALRGVWQESTR